MTSRALFANPALATLQDLLRAHCNAEAHTHTQEGYVCQSHGYAEGGSMPKL